MPVFIKIPTIDGESGRAMQVAQRAVRRPAGHQIWTDHNLHDPGVASHRPGSASARRNGAAQPIINVAPRTATTPDSFVDIYINGSPRSGDGVRGGRPPARLDVEA